MRNTLPRDILSVSYKMKLLAVFDLRIIGYSSLQMKAGSDQYRDNMHITSTNHCIS